jgi:hypothetical protein
VSGLSWLRRKREAGPLEPAPITVPADAVELVGLVGPKGTSGCRLRGDPDWTLNSNFIAWRRVGGELVSTPLHLSCTCGQEALKQLQGKLSRLSLARVRARFRVEGAELVEIVDDTVHDEELEDLAKKLGEPLERTVAGFGTLTFNRTLDWWEGKVPWRGETVAISFNAVGADELDQCLEVARELLRNAGSWDARAREFAARELLELKNDTWLGEEESKLSEEEFKSRLVMESLSFHADGDIEFWFCDGNLFLGHSIQVDARLVEGPTAAQIFG